MAKTRRGFARSLVPGALVIVQPLHDVHVPAAGGVRKDLHVEHGGVQRPPVQGAGPLAGDQLEHREVPVLGRLLARDAVPRQLVGARP